MKSVPGGLILTLVFLAMAIACNAFSTPLPPTRPTVRILSPSPGSQARLEQELYVQVSAEDPGGIAWIELWVDGAQGGVMQPPTPQVTYRALIPWKASAPGPHRLVARATSKSGSAAESAPVSIVVVSAAGQVQLPTAPALPITATPPSATASPTSAPALSPSPEPSVTASAIPTFAPTFTPIPATATPEPSPPPPPAPLPAWTPTPAVAPGIYVTSLGIDPPEPKSKPAQFSFRVGLFNTTGADRSSRWRVLIYRPDERRPMGDPQGQALTIPAGHSDQVTRPWEIKVMGCEPFYAKPVLEDADGRQTPLVQPNGQEIVVSFQVCS